MVFFLGGGGAGGVGGMVEFNDSPLSLACLKLCCRELWKKKKKTTYNVEMLYMSSTNSSKGLNALRRIGVGGYTDIQSCLCSPFLFYLQRGWQLLALWSRESGGDGTQSSWTFAWVHGVITATQTTAAGSGRTTRWPANTSPCGCGSEAGRLLPYLLRSWALQGVLGIHWD